MWYNKSIMAKVTRKYKKQNRQLPSEAPRRHRKHNWGLIIFFAILIIAAAIILYNLFQPVKFQDAPPEISQSDDTTSETIKPENVKGETKDASGKDKDSEAPEQKTTASDGTPIRNEGADPNSSASLTGAITYADAPNGALMIRTNIDQYLTSGTCDLTLTSNSISGVSYTMQVPIIPSVSSSSCDGFDYEAGEVRAGNYSIKIEVKSGGKSGILTGEVNL